MSILHRLLKGEATEATTLNKIGSLLFGGEDTKQIVRKMGATAQKSDIGGAGTPFNEMSAAHQREFLTTSDSFGAKKVRSYVDETPYQPSTPSIEHMSTSELLQSAYVGGTQAVSRQAGRVQGAVGDANTALQSAYVGSAQAVSRAPQAIGKAIEGAASNLNQGIDNLVTPVARTATASYGKAVTAGGEVIENIKTNIPADIQRVKTKSGQIVDAAKTKGGELIDTAVNKTKADITRGGTIVNEAVAKGGEYVETAQKHGGTIAGGLLGDTSGSAAINAGGKFMAGAGRVFESKATSEAFGVDRSILKQAWAATDENAFKKVLTDANVEDEAAKGLSKFRSAVSKVGDEGGNLSEEGMQAMLKNQGELGDMYGGFSRAGGTASSNYLLQGMGGESTAWGGNIMGLAAVAGLAGGANVMMGGDFFEGAAVGGGVAFGIRSVAKGVAGSMGDIESSMIKGILGDEKPMRSITTTAPDITHFAKGTRLRSITPEHDNRLAKDYFEDSILTSAGMNPKATIGDLKSHAPYATGLKPAMTNQPLITKGATTTTQEALTGGAARKHQLQTIKDMSADDDRLQGFGKKWAQKRLDPNKTKNVAMNNRMLTLGGGMLSGIAFTGQSDKRDYRRGFNRQRGNRI
ncbi:hypothetical protein CMI37_26025 [Candidatus Pacearchaeota archaeon]|nr:hypothetical protein [Candidatus Pacearchaeota archaeon]